MSDKTGPDSPFAAFSSTFPASMTGLNPDAWQKMWSMFIPPASGPGVAGNASAFGGMSAFPPSLSMMSEMIAPLTSVEELDKRIVDLRAVEHWLKLNLQMLQSTTQALEVQRATLATLKAFGAMGQATVDAAKGAAAGTGGTASKPASGGVPPMPPVPALDPAVWWSVINDQFKQLAAAAASATPAVNPMSAMGGAATPPAGGKGEKPHDDKTTYKNETAAQSSTATSKAKKAVRHPGAKST